MNSRQTLERQWAALVVRQPAARHILLKWLRAYQIEPHWFQIEDARAALMLRAIVTLTANNDPINVRSVAAYLARHDFTLSADEALHFVDGQVEALPETVDVERLALALLTAIGITFPEPEVAEYLSDPYGRRADAMMARKLKAWK